jgi:CubicO group peptidase (beta-lactamase class C family)
VRVQYSNGDLVSDDPLSPESSFNVLSVGKMFTAVAIMQLVDANIISLDATLGDLLTEEERSLKFRAPYDKENLTNPAELNQHAHEITLRHLLSHTAGLVPGEAGATWSKDQLGQYKYSNYGYQLLATIIGKYSQEAVPGETYEAGFYNHIRNCIFRPAHMDGAVHAMPPPEGAPTPDRFRVLDNGRRERIETPEPYPHGNGCWRMLSDDLLKFGHAMRHDALIGSTSFQDMQDSNPSLGLAVFKDGTTVKSYGHAGSEGGESCFLHIWRTDPEITAVVLSENEYAADRMNSEIDSALSQLPPKSR